jgi:hypothetical protein
MTDPAAKFIQLPSHIFILSDHDTRPLAIEVAKALSDAPCSMCCHTDFMDPIYNAAAELVSIEFGTDMGDPSQTPHKDLFDSLARWYDEYFGLDKLGQDAYAEWREAITDLTWVWRDAEWRHLKPFLSALKPHEVLIVDLKAGKIGLETELYSPFARQHLIFAKPTVENVLAAIEDACK